MSKGKKVRLSEGSLLDQEIVSALEDLFLSVKPSELRQAITAIYFDVTMTQTDFSLDFQIHSHFIFELIRFLEKASETGINKKKKGKKKD